MSRGRFQRLGAKVAGAAGLAAWAVLAAASGASSAWAHGGLSMEEDTCKLRVGPYTMHFSGYQPQSTAEREFCEDIPSTGPTVIVLDYLDDKLRWLPVEVRIVRDTGSEADLDSITVYRLPPTVSPRGSLYVEHTFPEPGRFVGLVTVGDSPPQVARFPFSVGAGRRWRWIYGLAAGVVAVAVGIGLFWYSNRRAEG